MAKFKFEKYKNLHSRYTCPKCKKKHELTRYIYSETGTHIADHVGRCNREVECGYDYTPKQYFADNNIKPEESITNNCNPKCEVVKPTSYISQLLFNGSLIRSQNHLITYLESLFGKETTEGLIMKYFIGTSRHWNCSTVFWQVDNTGKIRSGKIMLYNPKTGKRIKKPFNHITWVHKVTEQNDFNLKQCFFGEHLLNRYPSMPVAICESEKTAIISSIYLPQYLWLSSGQLHGLNYEKCLVLKGREVKLFPDLKCYERWNEKAKEFSSIASFSMSDMLENMATEEDIANGNDIADVLIRTPIEEFLKKAQIFI